MENLVFEDAKNLIMTNGLYKQHIDKGKRQLNAFEETAQ